MTDHYRQGDVLIQKVDSLPEGLIKCKASEYNGRARHVLAEGEVTGHAHAVYLPEVTDEDKEAVAELFRTEDGQLYLNVAESTTIDHEEHHSIALEPGVYKISGQREYTPQEIRRVAD